MWKYVENTTLAKTTERGCASFIQDDLDDLMNHSIANNFKFNEEKCKQPQIGFSISGRQFKPMKIHERPLEVVLYWDLFT